MDLFWKAAGLILISVILGLAIGKTEKDLSLLLTMVVCCMVATVAMSYLQPVFDLLWEINVIGGMQDGILSILLRAVGIMIATELIGMICNDAGNGSLGKALELLGSAAVLYLATPIFRTLLTLIREILGEL